MRIAFSYLCSLLIHGLILASLLGWSLRQTVPGWSGRNDDRLCLEMEMELAAQQASGEERQPEAIVETPPLPDDFSPREIVVEALPWNESPAAAARLDCPVPEIYIEDWSQSAAPAPQIPPPPAQPPDPRPTPQVPQKDVRKKPDESPSAVAPAANLPSQAAKARADVDALPQSHPSNPKPPYPREALRQGWEGVVYLRASIAADGSVSEVLVHRSSGVPVLDAVALETVRQKWRFAPARRGNTPVASEAILPIRFVIRQSNQR